jgi:hypothetical protein
VFCFSFYNSFSGRVFSHLVSICNVNSSNNVHCIF